MVTWIIIGVIVVVLLFLVVGAYNKLVALDQAADQSFADIDVQLRQRQDLIPNLVEAVKGYAGHERGTLEAVTEARAAAQGAGSVNEKVQAENMLTAALGRLFAVAEFNAVRRQFPTVLFAGLVGFASDKPFFDLGEADRAAMNAAPPQVKF